LKRLADTCDDLDKLMAHQFARLALHDAGVPDAEPEQETT